MSFVGEAALSVLLEGLFRKLSSSDVLNFVTENQVRKQLMKWEDMLRDMRAVLDDAEGKQVKDEHVKNWLADLQDLAYDVDDILDEFSTEALGRKLTSLEEPQSIRNKVQKLIPTRLFSLKSFIFNIKMMSKTKKISARMNDLATKRTQLELRGTNEGGRSNRMQRRLQPTSLMHENRVYGRDDEREAMIHLLLSNDDSQNGASVIPIVGLGGIGKTTLAQLVYNDPRINDSYGRNYKAWVCVSDDFDAVKITKTILQSIDPDSCKDITDLNLLQVKLKEMLAGKRFLLVLDDIWNEKREDLTILLSPFGVGTKILFTTRSHKVSSHMGAADASPLQKLSEDICLSIFTQHALGADDFSGHPELENFGKNIVKRCNGLPLAAKAIGCFLRDRLDYDAWKDISDSEIWDEESDILPALRLSYHHLPSHLKQCFVYCSIIPKDYEFKEEEIIMLWEAEGFLQQASPETQTEGLGRQYFRDLVSRSFFQTSTRKRSLFVMHDIVNDLAKSVAGDICATLMGDDKPPRSLRRTRHSSYARGEYDGMKKFEAFHQMKLLRTFLPLARLSWCSRYYLSDNVLVDLLPKLKQLRVLSLKGYKITELPNFFQNLRHLRYLDFSYTLIKSLPESICSLYNLKTLLLKRCRKLENLPSNLPILVNLSVLRISVTSMKGMPFGIDKLTNLRRLSDFVLGKGNGHQMQEMRNLVNLKRKLSISGLENIVKAEDAREAKLIDKSGLDTLQLKWSREFDNNRSKEVEEAVLNFLEPQKKLEKLSIWNYGGTRFPIWMNSLQNLSSLILSGCKNCVSLPAFGNLTSLKDLSICGMDELSKVGIEFYRDNPSNAFASLQSLSFEDMPRWEKWDLVDEQAVKFPSLVKLSIENCPQLLGTLPNQLHSLEKLDIRRCAQMVVSLSDLPKLSELHIEECAQMVVSISDLPKLSELHIEECAELVVRDDAEFLSIEVVHLSEVVKFSTPTDLGLLGHLRSRSLRKLEISNCPQLVLLGPNEAEEAEEELCNVESLIIQQDGLSMESLRIRKHFLAFITEMEIMECPNIVSFANNNLPPVLKKLKIEDCEKLRCLVDEGENMSFCNNSPLEHLDIRRCPSLISLSLPVRLRHLEIWLCSKLACLSESGNLPICLKQLTLYECPELESLAKAIDKALNLTKLSIEYCHNLRALPNCMHNLTSLRDLRVMNSSGDEISIPEEGICANLTSLEISVPRDYESLMQWGFHRLTSLKKLNIYGFGCLNIVSFPPVEIGMMLPPSLNSLTIEGFHNLKRLSSKGFKDLTSLHHLYIWSCPKLTSLPEKDMLLSLLELSICECPLLEEKCKRGKGREWSKIAHIPCVEINYETI